MSFLYAVIVMLLIATGAYANSGSYGTRFGNVTEHDGVQYEVYARVNPNESMMFEASIGQGRLDYVIDGIPVTDVNQTPINGVLAFKLPSKSFTPYVGAGASVIFSEYRKTFGSPIIQAGFELPIFEKSYLLFDYRHQFNQKTKYWFGGVGVKF